MQLVTSFILNESSQWASNYFEIRSKASLAKLSSMNEYCVYLPPWERKLLRFQYYFVGVHFHWLMLMQTISLYRSRPDLQESVRNSSSVYQDTRYQDFPSIAMSAIRSIKMKSSALLFSNFFSSHSHRPIKFITEPRSYITRQWYTAFHFYFYSNNDPTSPKGPRKQTTEQILGTALFGN